MSRSDFFDSNILLYWPTADAEKAARVESLLADGGTISIQVLNEFAAISSRKFGKTMPQIRHALAIVRSVCEVVAPDVAMHEQGLDIAERYKFSIYDSMLLASALQAGCRTFYSEDLHHGQRVGALTIRNPFRS
jgi:predicted nucleic acid-binding protein